MNVTSATWKLCKSHTSKNISLDIFTHESESVHGSYSLTEVVPIETEGILKVNGSYIRCKSCDISETVQHSGVVTADN